MTQPRRPVWDVALAVACLIGISLLGCVIGCQRPRTVVVPAQAITPPPRPVLPTHTLREDASCQEALTAALRSIKILNGHILALEILLQGPPKKPDTSSETRGKP